MRGPIHIALALALLMQLALLGDLLWRGGTPWHALLTTIAVMVAIIAGLVALARSAGALREVQRSLKRAEAELVSLNNPLVEAARRSGMAEIAITALHNVNHMLSSLSLSAATVSDDVQQLGISELTKAADLIEQNLDDLNLFLTRDERGRHLPQSLINLSRHMAQAEATLLEEIQSLNDSVDHVKTLIALEQSHEDGVGLVRETSLADLMEDAVRVDSASRERHRITVLREFQPVPAVLVDEQRLFQVVVNLLSNAKDALVDDRHNADKRIVVRLQPAEGNRARIEIEDNGVGIPPENITRIFSPGFTRPGRHGFGLYSEAVAARESGWELTAHSKGRGSGATFVITLGLNVARQTT